MSTPPGPIYDQPETWMPRFVGLFRADLDGRWVDITETKWADGWTDASEITLISATLNPAAGIGGAMYFLNQLQGVLEPLRVCAVPAKSASSSSSPSSQPPEWMARLKRGWSSTSRGRAGGNGVPFDLQSLTYEGKFRDDASSASATNTTLVDSAGPSSPTKSSSGSKPKRASGGSVPPAADSHPFPIHRREARPPHSRFPFTQDWPTIAQPCVVHLQGVTREVYAYLATKDPWLAAHFALAPGFGGQDGGGWPAGARYGNLTLVSHAVCVRGRPFLLDFPNSHPAIGAHAVFVCVRVLAESGHYRNVLLCNSLLEPPENSVLKIGEQTQQMRALTSWLFMDDSSSGSSSTWSGCSIHAGVFSGRVQSGVRDDEPGYELVDATNDLEYPAGGRILHTGQSDLRVEVGTIGFTAGNKDPKPLAVAARFSFAPGPHLNMERNVIE